ncbi:unnamed protein product [Urochloa humidicola]
MASPIPPFPPNRSAVLLRHGRRPPSRAASRHPLPLPSPLLPLPLAAIPARPHLWLLQLWITETRTVTEGISNRALSTATEGITDNSGALPFSSPVAGNFTYGVMALSASLLLLYI